MFALGLFLIAISNSVYAGLPGVGPVGEIEFAKISTCPSVKNNIIDVDYVASGKKRVANMVMKFPEEFNDNWTYSCSVSKWANNKYTPMFEQKGKFCAEVSNQAAKIRDNIFKMCGVKFTKKCVIPAGDYKLDNFYAQESELSSKQVPYGRFRTECKLMNPKGKVMSCLVIDAESKSK